MLATAEDLFGEDLDISSDEEGKKEASVEREIQREEMDEMETSPKDTQVRFITYFACKSKLSNFIWRKTHNVLIQGSYGQGKPEKVREFQNFSNVREKSGNFTIIQKLEKIFKNQNFWKCSKVWKFSKLSGKTG